ncbi:hypothetical protein, partial [Sphingomonas sp.]|uniref:hypothetical protein n=1 Tax=Sphingomonas sp. TaxID=28214 RepID=UPI0035C7BD0C
MFVMFQSPPESAPIARARGKHLPRRQTDAAMPRPLPAAATPRIASGNPRAPASRRGELHQLDRLAVRHAPAD